MCQLISCLVGVCVWVVNHVYESRTVDVNHGISIHDCVGAESCLVGVCVWVTNYVYTSRTVYVSHKLCMWDTEYFFGVCLWVENSVYASRAVYMSHELCIRVIKYVFMYVTFVGAPKPWHIHKWKVIWWSMYLSVLVAYVFMYVSCTSDSPSFMSAHSKHKSACSHTQMHVWNAMVPHIHTPQTCLSLCRRVRRTEHTQIPTLKYPHSQEYTHKHKRIHTLSNFM